MKNFQMNMGVLAFFVILSFISVGFAIGQENFWLAGFFFILGFVIMSFGLRLKRKLNA